MDGEACDSDGSVNGSCTFRVGACVNLPVGGCAADSVPSGEITKPSVKEANDAVKRPHHVYARRALVDALDALLLSEHDFAEERMRDKYSKPGQRCC